jgi:hypothetical protein
VTSAAPDEVGPVDPDEFVALLTDLLQSDHWWLPDLPDDWSSRVCVLTGSVRSLPSGLPSIITSETGPEQMPVGHRLTATGQGPDDGWGGEEDEEDEEDEYPEYDLTVAASAAASAEVVAAARESLQGKADVLVLFHLRYGPYVTEAGLFRLAAPIVLPHRNLMSGVDDEEHEARWFLMIEGQGSTLVMEAVEEICEDHFGFSQTIVEAVY